VQQKTILIIDDERGYTEALKDALNYEGFKVLTATTAEEALHLLKNNRVDLATVDIMMPPGHSLESQAKSDRTGVVLCRTIKKLYPRTQIICISVVSDINTIEEIESYNIRFLSKGEVPLRTILDLIATKLFGKTFNAPSDA
jgi:DNA-binding NarL/FixJ family response regulator